MEEIGTVTSWASPIYTLRPYIRSLTVVYLIIKRSGKRIRSKVCVGPCVGSEPWHQNLSDFQLAQSITVQLVSCQVPCLCTFFWTVCLEACAQGVCVCWTSHWIFNNICNVLWAIISSSLTSITVNYLSFPRSFVVPHQLCHCCFPHNGLSLAPLLCQ